MSQVSESTFKKEYSKAEKRFFEYNEFATFGKDDSIVLCFRGSKTSADWSLDLDVTFKKNDIIHESARFIRTHLIVEALHAAGPVWRNISLTGHSLGALLALYALTSPVFATVQRDANNAITSVVTHLPPRLIVRAYNCFCVPCDKGLKWIRNTFGSGGSNCETSEFDIVLKAVLEEATDPESGPHDIKIIRASTDVASKYCSSRSYLNDWDILHSHPVEELLPEGVQLGWPKKRTSHDLDLFVAP